MADPLIERAERWAIRGTRVEPGHISPPERVASGLVGAGLLVLSRADRRWRVPVALAAGAALTRAVTGVCPVYATLDLPPISTRRSLSGRRGEHVREHVHDGRSDLKVKSEE
jgi:hypothetical protein